MCRTIFILALIFFPFGIYAQDETTFQVPDYASINDMTADVNSAFYYPKLLKRYKDNDTNLSPREFRMLYYGYSLQQGYSPFTGFTLEDEELRSIFAKDDLAPADLGNIVVQSKKYLERFPFDLKKLNMVYIASKELGDSLTAYTYLGKIRSIALTILSTGDGLSKETAFYVISLPDEYAMIKMLGYDYNGDQQLSGSESSYLGIKDNSDKIPGFYFNAKPVFGSIPQAMK
jgi:hypothetical protein